ncbi:MAG: transposase, partial [Candidatus Izemoplasmatales bacterium]|nr:transposase [Candidatus Izemoplasmatales bacterium]
TMSSTGKLVKRGSKYLRATLINVCMMVMIHNPVFYDYYTKKKQEGKHHRVALIHLSKKLVRVIHHLETNHEDYDSKKLK